MSWLAGFSRRHGGAAPVDPVTPGGSWDTVTFAAADGATAECHPPFPPLPQAGAAAAAGASADVTVAAQVIVAHAVADRTVGVLLVRLGGYAAGVFTGSPPRLVSSKTGSRPVHGRSAAGGWSQHRFARRRENQAATALRAAAEAAAGVFGRYGPDGLDAVVLGGDKRAAAGLRGDARLEKYLAKAAERFLVVPDPRLAVLRDIPRAYLAIRIRLTEPESDGPVPGLPGTLVPCCSPRTRDTPEGCASPGGRPPGTPREGLSIFRSVCRSS